MVLLVTDYEENDNIGQEDNLEVWMQKGSKCYWIKKLIELFHAHPPQDGCSSWMVFLRVVLL